MNPLIARLTAEPTRQESLRMQEEMSCLEGLRRRSEGLSPEQWEEGLARLAPYRVKSSSSLKNGLVSSWQEATFYVARKIQEGENPGWEDVLQLNALLLEKPRSEIRTEPVYLGPREACPVEQLPESLAYFKTHILPLACHPHPLIAAALCQYWLVSLHPFDDANGRTAVLVTDWILGSHAFLPMSFATKLDALVASLSDERVSATPAQAILKLLRNVQRSYRLVLGEPGALS